MKPTDCEIVIEAGLDYGFTRHVGRWTGDRRIREALVVATENSTRDTHDVIVATLKKWPGATDEALRDQDDWYLHALRDLIARLMANQVCADTSVDVLEGYFNRINQLQRNASRQTNLAMASTVEVIRRRPSGDR